MTSEEAALMAERFQWTKGGGIYTQVNSPTGDHIRSYTTEYYSQGFGRPMLEAICEPVGAEPEYHLTDAGMARVLIEGEIGLSRSTSVNEEKGWIAYGTHPYWSAVPHEAVAEAALAQIRGEG